MNGRTAKLLRKVFDPSESDDKRREYRRFKRAYTEADSNTQADVRKQASKIWSIKRGGGEVKTFKVNQETHQMEVDNGTNTGGS